MPPIVDDPLPSLPAYRVDRILRSNGGVIERLMGEKLLVVG